MPAIPSEPVELSTSAPLQAGWSQERTTPSSRRNSVEEGHYHDLKRKTSCESDGEAGNADAGDNTQSTANMATITSSRIGPPYRGLLTHQGSMPAHTSLPCRSALAKLGQTLLLAIEQEADKLLRARHNTTGLNNNCLDKTKLRSIVWVRAAC